MMVNPVTKLEVGEKYDIYVVRNGRETSQALNTDLTASEVRKALNKPVLNSKTGLWENKYGKTYRIRRSREREE